MEDKVRIVCLGGLDEEGKNCIVIEINDDIFVVGCGLRLPDKMMPGIDYVIPQFDYLSENKDRVRAYFLLHGHDDETGALAYIYDEVPAPIYGSAVTLNMFRLFTSHIGKDPSRYKTCEVPATSHFKVAGRDISYFHTAHNIADSSGIAISTSLGNIIYTGDFVVENTAMPSYLHDMKAIASIAEKPTLALLTESVYASRPGYTAPLYRLSPQIEDAFKGAQGRIFVSLFSSNFFNFDELISLAIASKRKIICYDQGTLDLLKAMQQCGKLMIPRDNFASLDELLRLRDQDIVCLISGFGGRLFRKIALLASGENEDKRVSLKKEDTFIVASPSQDATEIEYVDAVDELFRTGCHVVNVNKKTFLKMHASEEDLKMMASILKPKYYIPVSGFYKDLLHNAMTIVSMGINLNHRNVFVIDNGVSVLIDENGGRVFDEKIPHGDVMIDGTEMGGVSQAVLDDREKLTQGVVVLALTLKRSEYRIIAGPDVQMRGFVFVKDADMILREVSKVFLATVTEFLTNADYNLDEIKQNAYERCLRCLKRLTGNEPMVLPLIVEID